MAQDDFDYTMGEGEPQPKKGFLGGVFTKKEKDVTIDTRRNRMAQPQPMSDDLMKLLGGQYKGPDDQNMALDYVGNSYVPIGDTYKPIADTYKGDPYVSAKYEPMKYESPGYESASGVLFGEQGKAWEDSPVFKRSSPGLFESQTEKSPLYNPTGMSDILFGNKEETPMMSAVTGRPMDFPLRNPASQPFQAVTPVTQFTPSPVNVASMVTPFTPPVQTPVQPVYIPPVPVQAMPTMPTQVIPPQYVPTAPVPQFKRPVGRPRLNKPPKAKRPVGRPRMVREETQMTEMQ
jgi:hypothetical protein